MADALTTINRSRSYAGGFQSAGSSIVGSGSFFQTINNLSEGDPATMQTNLNLVPGTDVQAYSNRLQEISDIGVPSNDAFLVYQSGWAALTGNTARSALGLAIADSPTFANVTISNAPSNNTHAATKGYVDAAVSGLDWQESVIDELNTPPGSPSTGDRYLILTSPTGAWSGQGNNIAEWNGSSWDITIPDEGTTLEVEDTGFIKIFNGTTWVRFGSAISHSQLQDLSADDHSQYLHISTARIVSVKHTWNADIGFGNQSGVSNLNHIGWKNTEASNHTSPSDGRMYYDLNISTGDDSALADGDQRGLRLYDSDSLSWGTLIDTVNMVDVRARFSQLTVNQNGIGRVYFGGDGNDYIELDQNDDVFRHYINGTQIMAIGGGSITNSKQTYIQDTTFSPLFVTRANAVSTSSVAMTFRKYAEGTTTIQEIGRISFTPSENNGLGTQTTQFNIQTYASGSVVNMFSGNSVNGLLSLYEHTFGNDHTTRRIEVLGSTTTMYFRSGSNDTNSYRFRANISDSVDGGMIFEDWDGNDLFRIQKGIGRSYFLTDVELQDHKLFIENGLSRSTANFLHDFAQARMVNTESGLQISADSSGDLGAHAIFMNASTSADSATAYGMNFSPSQDAWTLFYKSGITGNTNMFFGADTFFTAGYNSGATLVSLDSLADNNISLRFRKGGTNIAFLQHIHSNNVFQFFDAQNGGRTVWTWAADSNRFKILHETQVSSLRLRGGSEDREEGVRYQWASNNSSTNGATWYNIADITLPSGTYRGGQIHVEYWMAATNHGANTNLRRYEFTISFRRSGATEGSYDDAIVTGYNDDNSDRIRVVRTALGVYELQARAISNNVDWGLDFMTTSNASMTVTPILNHNTAGSAGTEYYPATNISNEFHTAASQFVHGNVTIYGNGRKLQMLTNTNSVMSGVHNNLMEWYAYRSDFGQEGGESVDWHVKYDDSNNSGNEGYMRWLTEQWSGDATYAEQNESTMNWILELSDSGTLRHALTATTYSGGGMLGINTLRPLYNLHVTGNIGFNGYMESSGGYVSGIMGSGSRWDLGTGFLETNSMRIRGALYAHIFQVDKVTVRNSIDVVSDGGELTGSTGTTGTGTVTFRDATSATFEIGEILWCKDISQGTGLLISSVRFRITGAGSSSGGETTYNVTAIEGDLSDINDGMTAVRTSGGYLLFDASTTYSPFMDIYDETTQNVFTGSDAVPSNTDYAGGDKWYFHLDHAQLIKLSITGIDFEGGIRAGLNGVNLGSMSGPDQATQTYDFYVNGVSGTNEISIWASNGDGGTTTIIDVTEYSSIKSRLGNLSGITSKTFGSLEGFGLWTNRGYFEGDVRIAGTLTAGDKNNIGPSFYAGRIRTNILPNSNSWDDWSTPPANSTITINAAESPDGTTNAARYAIINNTSISTWLVQSNKYDIIDGQKYIYSIWAKRSIEGQAVQLQFGFRYDTSALSATIVDVTDDWVRYSGSVIADTSISARGGSYIDIPGSTSNEVLVYGFQIEPVNPDETLPSPYQETDGTVLSLDAGFGMWARAGGFGGTMQNPVWKIDEQRLSHDSTIWIGKGLSASAAVGSNEGRMGFGYWNDASRPMMIINGSGSGTVYIHYANATSWGIKGRNEAGQDIFDLGYLNQIAGWEFNNTSFFNNSDTGDIFLYATRTINGVTSPGIRAYAGSEMMATMGMSYHGDGTTWGTGSMFGLQVSDFPDTIFMAAKNIGTGNQTVNGDTVAPGEVYNTIASWRFNATRIWRTHNTSGYLELLSSGNTNRVLITPDGDLSGGTGNFVNFYYNSTTDWGIAGKKAGDTIFQLGNVNQIASWTFTLNALYRSAGGVVTVIGSPDDVPGGWSTVWDNAFSVGSDGSNRIWFGNNGSGGYEFSVYESAQYVVRLGNSVNKIAGWNLDSQYFWSGTRTASNAYSTDGVTLASGGAIRTPNFRVDTDGQAYFKGVLEVGAIPNMPPLSDMVFYVPGDNSFVNMFNETLNSASSGTPTFVQGVNGRAIEISGNEYVDWAEYSEIDFSSSADFSMSFWVNIASGLSGAVQALFAKGNYSYTYGFYLSNGSLVFGTRDAVNVINTRSITPTQGEWIHLVGIVDQTNDEIRLYQNGVLVGTRTGLTSADISLNDAMRLGGPPLSGTPIYNATWYGDEFMIFNRALTDNEIKALYTNPSGYSASVIDGTSIKTGSIISNNYSYTSGNFSTAGTRINLSSGDIYSVNFSIISGTARFKGDITGASGTFSGALSATSGTIAGWSINANRFLSGNMLIASNATTQSYPSPSDVTSDILTNPNFTSDANWTKEESGNSEVVYDANIDEYDLVQDNTNGTNSVGISQIKTGLASNRKGTPLVFTFTLGGGYEPVMGGRDFSSGVVIVRIYSRTSGGSLALVASKSLTPVDVPGINLGGYTDIQIQAIIPSNIDGCMTEVIMPTQDQSGSSEDQLVHVKEITVDVYDTPAITLNSEMFEYWLSPLSFVRLSKDGLAIEGGTVKPSNLSFPTSDNASLPLPDDGFMSMAIVPVGDDRRLLVRDSDGEYYRVTLTKV